MILKIIFRSVVVAGLISLAMIPSCKAYSPFINHSFDKEKHSFPKINLVPEVTGVLLPAPKPWIIDEGPLPPVLYDKSFTPKAFHYNSNGVLNVEFEYEPNSDFDYNQAKLVFYEEGEIVEIVSVGNLNYNSTEGKRLVLSCRCTHIAYYNNIEVWIPAKSPYWAYKRQVGWIESKERYIENYQLYLIGFFIILVGHVSIVERRVVLNYIQWKREASTGESWAMTYTVVGVLLLALVFFITVIGIIAYGFIGDGFTGRIWSSHSRLVYCIESIYDASAWLLVGGGFLLIESLMVNDVRFYWMYVVDKWAMFMPHSKDEYGVLWNSVNNIENFQVVDVVNSTPSHPERHLIPVPSKFQTPKAAIAWTFGLKENEYNPVKQT